MRIALPDNHRAAAVKGLRAVANSSWGGGGQWPVALFIFPHLVDTDELKDAVRAVLKSEAPGYRGYAASILDALGDADGLAHLVFEALKIHPVYGFDHTKRRSGWTDLAVARRAHRLTAAMVDSLLKDMLPPRANGCVDSVSLARNELVVEGATSLLSHSGDSALFGACILAAHGDGLGIDEIIRGSREGCNQAERISALSTYSTG